MINIPWNPEKWQIRFFSLWSGQAISLFGSHLVQFALIWWLTEKTGSATVLAMASLVGFLPQVFLGPFVGTLVDRWNRRAVMILADVAIALATFVLVFLFSQGLVTTAWIYAMLFLRSLGGAFHYPAMSAATSLMVPKEQLTRVQGLNQMLQGVLMVFAAPVGAMAVEWLATEFILMIDIFTALFAVMPLLVLAIPEPARAVNGNGEIEQIPFWQDFKAGFRYVAAWPGLLMIVSMSVILNMMLTPTSSLQPLLITEYYGRGVLELGWMQSAFGGGIVVGGILLSVWGGFKKRILTSLWGIIGLGISFALIGLIPANAFFGAVLAAFSAAVMLPMINGPIRAILQAAVDPKMQGRVFTLVGSMATAMAPLGLVFAGPLAEAFGVRTWYIASGLVCLLVGAGGFFIPAILAVEENRREAPSSSEAVSPDHSISAYTD